MDSCVLLILVCTVMTTSAWSIPYYPVQRVPPRVTRFAPPPPQVIPVRPARHTASEDSEWDRPKRQYDDYHHGDRDHRGGGGGGVTGPVHTFVKTDKNANYKWGVRHHVGDKYAP